jgi:predicted SpoU family rRNA methylase
LAIFLDRFFEGKELTVEFEKAKMQIIPEEHGKNIKVNEEKI